MSSTRLPHRTLRLERSVYPARIGAATTVIMALLLITAGLNVAWVIPVCTVVGWRTASTLRYAMRMELVEDVLTLIDHRGKAYTLPGNFRLVMLGPWLVVGRGFSWCHIFTDQAERKHLHPFIQWLWLHRAS